MSNKNPNYIDYKFNSSPYDISIDKFSLEIRESNHDNLESFTKIFDNLELLISEKMEECLQIATEMRKVHKDNSELQMEQDALEKEENQQSHTNFSLRDGKLPF